MPPTITIHSVEMIRRGAHWVAECSCGWVSRVHDSQGAASHDATGHVEQMCRANA
jgi:hypothetical protein